MLHFAALFLFAHARELAPHITQRTCETTDYGSRVARHKVGKVGGKPREIMESNPPAEEQKEEHNASQRPVILLGVLKDIHNLGILILKHALERGGFRVVSAGAMLSQEEIIGAAVETGAKAVLVSSSYGMAALDAEGLRGKCEEAGLAGLLLYIGGNLAVTRQSRKWQEIEAEFKALGFDRVYQQDVMPAQVIADLRQDLGIAA